MAQDAAAGEVREMHPNLLKRGVQWFKERPWIWLIVVGIALVALVWWGWDLVAGTVGIRHTLKLVAVALRDFAGAMGPWGPFLIVMALAAHSVVIVFPMEVPTLAAFALYGPFGGVAVIWTGSMVAAAISFMLGRLIGPPVLKRWENNQRVQMLVGAVEHLNPMALVLLRWISLIPFDVLNMIFGTCRVPIARFAWTTAIGVLATNIVMAVLYRTALHAHWGQLVGLLALVFIVGWGVYWWAGRTHLKRISTSDDIKS